MITLDVSPSIQFTYLAEGAANVVYRIHETSSAQIEDSPIYSRTTPPPSEIDVPTSSPLSGKLCRFRKAVSTVTSVHASHDDYEKYIAPLLDSAWIIEQELCHVTPRLLEYLNADLGSRERAGIRPTKRHGVYLATDEGYGSLITDMTAEGNQGYQCIELKPKWLLQSPSAPVDAKRCRTCALRAMRAGSESSNCGICPLTLTSRSREDVEKVVNIVLDGIGSSMRVRGRLMDYLMENKLLPALRDLQARFDPSGPLEADARDMSFLIAMTLRDCTLFVKIPNDESVSVEGRLGDLDLKSPRNGKAEYWKGLESRLIEEGWYTCTENNGGRIETVCSLARTKWREGAISTA